jgi:glycosyltransferase involved in cell wall biosynthesis
MIKRVYIVGTDPESGLGGISTSSKNLIAGLKLEGVDVRSIVSHHPNSKVKSFLFSVFSVIRCSDKDALFWIQLGPWVSLIRKILLISLIKIFGGKVLIQIHSQTFEQYSNNYLMRLLLQLLLKMSDKVAVLGFWWKKLVHRKYSLKDEKIVIIPNFVSMNSSDNKIKKLVQYTTINLLSMSRLVKGKGFEDVLVLLKQLDSRFHLSIAGEGPLKKDLIAYVKKYDLGDRVTFCGWINGNEKKLLLARSDVFVLPSRNDSFGMVYIESMMEGTPVIALNYKGVTDVINNGASGLLCSTSEPQELKHAVLKILSDYDRFSKKSIEHVYKNFSDVFVIPKIIKELKIYNEKFDTKE